MSDLGENNTKNKNHDQGYKERRIITIASFCFALVSWAATAEGMRKYVFSSGIEAGLISFGIQSILFAFNLRLPYFVEKIGKLTPDGERKKKGNRYKWTVRQKLVAAFYAFILLSSSVFSFVYICNSVIYEHDTGYVDDNTALQYKYRKVLVQTQDAIDESMKALPLIASAQLADLQQELNDAGLATDKSETLEALKKVKLEAENNWDICKQKLTTAQRNYDTAKEALDNAGKAMYWRTSEYEVALANYNSANDELESAEKEETEAHNAYKIAQSNVDGYKPSSGTLVSTILAELLKTNPETSKIENAMNGLMEYIVNLGEASAIPSNYTQIVKQSQSVNTTINQYIKLCGTTGEGTTEESAKALAERLKNQMNNSEPIPNPDNKESFQEELSSWRNEWKKKYNDLQALIMLVPTYSEDELEGIGESVVDTNILINYQPEKLSDSLNDTAREKLTDINVMERAFLRLFRKYRITAVMSIIIAFGLDISSLFAGIITFWMEKSDEICSNASIEADVTDGADESDAMFQSETAGSV